jgi:hypothetical protein
MSTATMTKPSEKTTDFATDSHLDSKVRTFLKKLNSGSGPPMEEMAPLEARKVLEQAQASVQVDLSGVEVSEKMITADGYTIKLNIVRPQGETKSFRCLFSSMVVVGFWAISPHTSAWYANWWCFQVLQRCL